MAETRRQIAARRGYMVITVRERGSVPRNMKKAFNAASKKSWPTVAKHFHEHMRDDRFTPEHARKAHYALRKGQTLSRGSKAFRQSYYGRKLFSKDGGGEGKANPLQMSGKTRRAVRTASITATSRGARAAYAGARVFNRLNAKSDIKMNEEFRRLLPGEIIELAGIYDRRLDQELKLADGA